MDQLLDNPVFYALQSGDAHLGSGTDTVKFFHAQVSPFAGFDEHNKNGFSELYNLLPDGRRILYASRQQNIKHEGWQLTHHIPGVQFLFTGKITASDHSFSIVKLETKHVDEMIALASLTKPGPFDKRTIEFGHYYGIFENGKLAAMTGQRLHVKNYTEVSAVCTDPQYTGKGFAAALLQHQLTIILNNEQIPFLHVRQDNERAIDLYKRLGFKQNGVMHFYFLKRTK